MASVGRAAALFVCVHCASKRRRAETATEPEAATEPETATEPEAA